MEEQVIRSIRRVCASGLDSVTLRRELVRRVEPVVPHDAYAFSTSDPDTGLMAHTVADNIPFSLARTYIERVYPNETALRTLDAARSKPGALSLFETSPAARDEFRAHGVSAEIHITLVADGRLRGTWCLMRGRRYRDGLERAATFFDRVVPIIARGLKSAAVVDDAHGLAAVNDNSLTTPGVLVLDPANRPVVRTPAARRWLRDLADVGFPGADNLPMSVLGVAARLRRTRVDVPEDVSLRLLGASGRWYSLRGSLTEPDVSAANTVVIVVRPAVRREVAALLTRLYGLSKREREVVAAVGRGEPTKCIAASLGVSPHTVDEHLERACRKVGVRGRKALIAKIFIDGYAPTVGAARPTARTA